MLAKKRKEIVLADAKASTEAMNVKFPSLDPPANSLAGYANLRTDLLDAVHARKLRDDDHRFGS